MNWVRTKKKAKEVPEGHARASTESDVPSLHPIKKTRTFGRSKKHEPEPAPPPLDVANALPPSDDFRTSLLMSGLSARFSMLREQDDPNSKIGKASDDSVLFPKGKFNDFSFQSRYGLSNIAEVSSIHGSPKPTLAKERKDSYSTLNGDDDLTSGSIMNRSKPGEGNSLFGGRQKVYKIPGKSTTSLGESGGMGGRALYDQDVSQSQFQKLREKEREEERQRLEKEQQEEAEAEASGPPSPPLSGYNRNRETTSTTSSAGPSNARISTAATSITSQRTPSLSGSYGANTPGGSTSSGNLERSATKTRRLYETGLDQHLHEQQHSAMSRIDTLSKRTIGSATPPMNSPTGPLSPTGAAHMMDRWDKPALGGKGSMPNMRTTSPPPNAAFSKFDFAVKSIDQTDSKSYGVASPPLSSPVVEQDDTVVLPVQPNDRGKATALGTFQRPSHAYDESKYSQRQVQMQQGRDVQPPRKHSPPNAFAPRQSPRSRTESNATFASAASGHSARSRSSSSVQRQGPASGPSNMVHAKIPEDSAAVGSFLGSPDESTVSSPGEVPLRSKTSVVDLTKMHFRDQNINLERPPESQHPAHRTAYAESIGSGPEFSPALLTPDYAKPVAVPTDSPTLGPTATMSGLSGMVRQHMRVDSNSSSIYGGASAYGDGPSTGHLTSRFPLDPMDPMPQNIYNSTSNPWDHDDSWDQGFYGDNQVAQPKISLDTELQPIRDPAVFSPQTRLQDTEPQSMDPAVHSPRNKTTEESQKPSWETELKSHHTRNGSTETQRERQDFKNDLAERRRRVQENLKSFVETDSRSSSPASEHRVPLPKSNPLGMLRAKTSKSNLSIKVKDVPPTKNMKMLGIGSATMTSSPSPNKQSFDAEAHRRHDGEPAATGPPTSEESQMAAGQKGQFIPAQAKAFRQARRDAQRERERQVAMRHNQGNERDGHHPEWPSTVPEHRPQREGYSQRVPPNIKTSRPYPAGRENMAGPPPMQSRQRPMGLESQNSVGSNRSEYSPRRDRTTSDVSGPRSKSRNGRFKDDMGGLQAPNHSHLAPKSPGTPGTMVGHSPVPSPMIPSPMMTPSGRSQSSSRAGPGPGSYFESQKLQPMKTDFVGLPLSPRPSPTAPFVINPTPVQPSPGNSAVNTPVTPAFQPQKQHPGARKRSINKHEISEPTFLSSTSRITTVNLPPEASLANGMEVGAPPIPPVNPMRRQTRGMFGLRKKEEFDDVHSLPTATQSTEEMSTFSDEDSKPSKPRQRLRKISSEGGNLSAKARQPASTGPTPVMPANYAASRNNSPPRPTPPTEGTMF